MDKNLYFFYENFWKYFQHLSFFVSSQNSETRVENFIVCWTADADMKIILPSVQNFNQNDCNNFPSFSCHSMNIKK